MSETHPEEGIARSGVSEGVLLSVFPLVQGILVHI